LICAARFNQQVDPTIGERGCSVQTTRCDPAAAGPRPPCRVPTAQWRPVPRRLFAVSSGQPASRTIRVADRTVSGNRCLTACAKWILPQHRVSRRRGKL